KKILINGKIYTEDKSNPWAEAVAIKDNIFVAVGSNKEIIQYAKFNFGEYEIVDLKGKTVLPGFIEGHSHPSLISSAYWVIFSELPFEKDKEKLYANIKEAAKKYPKEVRPYFVYSSYCIDTFNGEGPSMKDLDELIPDRPARINDDSGHGCVYNTMALNMIKDENGVPHSLAPVANQTFFKDENGNYTGRAFQTVQNGDIGVFEALNWKPDLAMSDNSSKDILDYLNHYGDIGVMDALILSEEDVAYVSKRDKEGRLYFYYDVTVMLTSTDSIEETIATAHDWQKKYETDHVRIRTVKFFSDGSNEADDTLSLEPFGADPEGVRGKRCNFELEPMIKAIVRLNEERLDLHVHCVCDGTLRRLLDAIEAAQKICGDDWCIKVTIAHLEIMHPDDAKRFKKLGICADISAHWLGSIPEITEASLGEKRSQHYLDFTQFINDDICYGFSSDNMSPIGIQLSSLFIGIEIAMTRIHPVFLDRKKYPNGRPPMSSKFTLEQCIHAITYNNAKRMRILDKVGSIEVGKRACLTILNKDIFTIPVEEIHTIEPDCIYFDGKELRIPNPLLKK
ncbi:MAG: amidohydrolase family protein, partial [Bacilli bacterium]|nr:amidohydrolase family protein [Bacilli bacterium]